ncbi:MAG: hypothetical protein HY023_03935 [Chloroflexi bacterium]|nr:hypothetical protein [Chloroflexota bacterium]
MLVETAVEGSSEQDRRIAPGPDSESACAVPENDLRARRAVEGKRVVHRSPAPQW